MIRVLNLGAGVQSTTLYLWAIDGEIEFDFAVFADTQEEPAAVYEHLQFLKSLNGPRIIETTVGSLGDNLANGKNSTGQRYISIPTFLAIDGEPSGIGRRQCTREYKIEPIEKAIRTELGLSKGERLPKDQTILQLMGLSFDEPKRVARVRDQFRGRRQWQAAFPLFDEFMTRTDCERYLEKRIPGHPVPRSACVFCPYHDDQEWMQIKQNDPAGWRRAVEIDRAIRLETSATNRGLRAKQYLHRSCQPLELVELNPNPKPRTQRMSFAVAEADCLGYCGR